MHPFYRIVVRPDEKDPLKFMLFNEASGAGAGDRLYKGEDANDPKQRWPFKKGAEWVTYDRAEDAEKAAVKLQNYLEARERNKGKTKKKPSSKT